jgi:hypothetical protein
VFFELFVTDAMRPNYGAGAFTQRLQPKYFQIFGSQGPAQSLHESFRQLRVPQELLVL